MIDLQIYQLAIIILKYLNIYLFYLNETDFLNRML